MVATSVRPTDALIEEIMEPFEGEVWDWYVVGGRWTGFFRLRPGAEGVRGEPWVMNRQPQPGTADQARKCDIDWEGMVAQAKAEARFLHRKIVEAREGRALDDRALEADLLLRGLLPPFTLVRNFFVEDEDEFVRLAGWTPFTPHGFVEGIDGEGCRYITSGFGFGSHIAQSEEWVTTFRGWLDSLPEDCWLTILDCHY